MLFKADALQRFFSLYRTAFQKVVMRSNTLKTSIWIYFLLTSAGFIDCGGYRLRYQGTEGESDDIPQIRASRYTEEENLKSSRSQLTLAKEQGYHTGSQIDEGKGIGNVMKEFLLQKDERSGDQSTIATEQAQNIFGNERVVQQDSDIGKNENVQNSNGKPTFQINIKADLIEGKHAIGGVSELIDTAISKLKGLHGISTESSQSDHNVNGKIGSEINTDRSSRNEYALEERAKLENVMQNNPKELIYDTSSKDASGVADVSATYARQGLSREQGRYYTDDQIGKTTRTELVDFRVNADSKNFELGRYDNRKEVTASSGVNGGVNGEIRNLDNGKQTASTVPNYSIEADYSRRIKNTPHGGTEDIGSRREITTELSQVGQSDHARLSTEFNEDGNRRQKDTTKDIDLKIVIGDSSKSIDRVDQNPSLYRKEKNSTPGTQEYKTKDDTEFSNGDYLRQHLKDNDEKIISTELAANTDINHKSESIGIEAVEPENNSFKKEIFETETQQQEKSPSRVTKAESLILEKSEPYISENRGYQNRQDVLESSLGNYKVNQIGSQTVHYNTGSSYNIDGINGNSKGIELENQDSTAIRKDLVHDIGPNAAVVEDSTLKDRRLQGLLIMNSQSEKGVSKQSETEDYIAFGKTHPNIETGHSTGTGDEYPITYLTEDYTGQGRLADNTDTSESIKLRDHDSTDLRKKGVVTSEIEDSDQSKSVIARSKPQFTDSHGHVPYDRNIPNLTKDLGNYGYTKKITIVSDEIETPERTDEAIHTDTTANAMGSVGQNFVNSYSGQNRQTGNYYTIDVINNGENSPYRDSKAISQPVTAAPQIERDIRTKGVTRSDGTMIVDRKSESFLIDGLKGQSTSKVLEGGGGSTALRREVTVTMLEPEQYYVNTGKVFTTDDIKDSRDRIELERQRSSYLGKENIEQDSVVRNGGAQSYLTSCPNRQIVANENGSPSSTTFRKEVTVTTSGIGKTGDGINVEGIDSQLTQNLGSHDIQTGLGYNIRGIGDSIRNVELDGDKLSNLQRELDEISGNIHSMRVKENTSRNSASQNIRSQSYFTGNPDRRGISSEYGSPSSTAFGKEVTVTTSGIGQSRRIDDEISRGRSRSQLTQNLGSHVGQDIQSKPGYNIREIGVSSENVELGGYRSSNLEKESDEISGNSRSMRVKDSISQNRGSQAYLIGNAERQRVSSGYENPSSTAFRKDVALPTSQIGQSSTREDVVSRGIESQLPRTLGTHSELGIPLGIGFSTGGLDRNSESFDFNNRGTSALNTKDSTTSEIQADIGLDKVFKGYSSTQNRGPQSYFTDSQKEKSISNGFTDLSPTGFRKEVTVTISGNEQGIKSDGLGSRPYESESAVSYKLNDYPGSSGSAFRREIGEIEHDIKTAGGQVGGFQNSEWQKIPTSFTGQDSTALRKDVKATSAVRQFSTPLDTKTTNPPYQLPERNPDEVVHSKGSSLTTLGLSTGIETDATFQTGKKPDQNIRTGGGDITTQRSALISRSEDNNREQEVGQSRTNQFDSNTYIENQGHNFRYSDSSATRDHLQSKINPGLYSDFGYNFRYLTGREFPRGYDNLHNNRQHGRNHYRNDDISDHYASQNQGVSEIRRRLEYLSEPKPLTYTTVVYRNEPAFHNYSHPPLYGRIPEREHLININGRREDNTDLYVSEQFNKAALNTNSRRPGKKEISFDEHTGEPGHININIKENSSSIPKVEPSISFEGYGSSGITETNSNKNLYEAKDQSSNGPVDHSWSFDRNGRKVYKLPIPNFEIYREP